MSVSLAPPIAGQDYYNVMNVDYARIRPFFRLLFGLSPQEH